MISGHLTIQLSRQIWLIFLSELANIQYLWQTFSIEDELKDESFGIQFPVAEVFSD